MNRKDTETYEMLTAVAGFASNNVGLFPKTSAAAEILAALETGMRTLSQEASTIASAGNAIRIGRSARKAARENLKATLGHVSRIAVALNSNEFSLPAKRGDRELIRTAKAFTADAEALKKEFGRHGLPFESVNAAATALEESILNAAAAKTRRSAAVAKWTAALQETLSAVKRYDALVATILGKDPGALAAYANARALRRAGGRKAAGETAPAVEPSPVVSVPAIDAATKAAGAGA